LTGRLSNVEPEGMSSRENKMSWYSPISTIGNKTLSLVERVGAMNIMYFDTLRALVPPRFDRNEMWRQLHKVGVQSLPLVSLTAFLVGVIMVIQGIVYVKSTGATSFVGAAAGIAVLSELGPSLIGIMFSGRVGANTTAELGNMVVSEQVESLRALAIDPVRFLVVPRFIAIVVSLVMLTIVGDLFGLIGGGVTCHYLLEIDWRTFVSSLLDTGLMDELIVGLIKAAAFGIVISTVSTTYGLTVSGGAKGVGRAVNGCVVTTALGIFLSDYIITWGWYQWMEW